MESNLRCLRFRIVFQISSNNHKRDQKNRSLVIKGSLEARVYHRQNDAYLEQLHIKWDRKLTVDVK